MTQSIITQSNERIRFSSDGRVGIGTTMPKTTIENYNEWQDILELAKTNPAVKLALDKLRTTYYLSKDNGSET